jgi:UTP:GlnB (protein PII) uridylyltransferase
MATFFRNSTVPGVGQTQSLILETDASQLVTVIGLSLTNKTANVVSASIFVRDDLSVDTYFVKDIVIAPNTTLRAVTQGEKLILGNSNQLLVSSSQDDSIDVVASFVIIV